MTLNDHFREAIKAVASMSHDLSKWNQFSPDSEKVPRANLVTWLRNAWPHRRIMVDHQRKSGHAVVAQEVIVFPSVMLTALAREMEKRTGKAWDVHRLVRFNLD